MRKLLLLGIVLFLIGCQLSPDKTIENNSTASDPNFHAVNQNICNITSDPTGTTSYTKLDFSAYNLKDIKITLIFNSNVIDMEKIDPNSGNINQEYFYISLNGNDPAFDTFTLAGYISSPKTKSYILNAGQNYLWIKTYNTTNAWGWINNIVFVSY